MAHPFIVCTLGCPVCGYAVVLAEAEFRALFWRHSGTYRGYVRVGYRRHVLCEELQRRSSDSRIGMHWMPACYLLCRSRDLISTPDPLDSRAGHFVDGNPIARLPVFSRSTIP